MAAAPATTAAQREMIAVKANCKKAYDWLRTLSAQASRVITLIEANVLSNPDDDEAKELLLETMATFRRKKTVVSYEVAKTHLDPVTNEVVYDKTASGEQIWEKLGHEEEIDTTSWRVSIVKRGTAVRIHLTEDAADEFVSDWDKRVKNAPHQFRNVVVYR
jgi:hypothetical protein